MTGLIADRLLVEEVHNLEERDLQVFAASQEIFSTIVSRAESALEAGALSVARQEATAARKLYEAVVKYRRWPREVWRDHLLGAQRFEVSPVFQMLGSSDVERVLDQTSSPDLRLPYTSCWVEGRFSEDLGAGLLLHETTNRCFDLQIFWDANGSLDFSGAFRLVTDGPRRLLVQYPHRATECDDNARTVAGAALYAIHLLNCRNIDAELVAPSPRDRRDRARRYKPPLFTYHVLRVRVGQAWRRLSDVVPPGHRDMRLHDVMGHFKTFTPERPGFGRLVGRYWCPPFVRGSRRLGAVEKDYAVVPEVAP